LKASVGMIDGESALVSVTLDQAQLSTLVSQNRQNDSNYREYEVARARSLVKKLVQEKR